MSLLPAQSCEICVPPQCYDRHVNLISGVGWHDFHKKIRKAQRAAFRPRTFANLKCHLRTYLLFCGAFDRQPFPVKKDTICAYFFFLAENFKSFNLVQNYMSGVKTWSSLPEYNNGAYESPMLKLTLTGLSKLNLSILNRRLPFQPQHLLDIYESLDFTLTRGFNALGLFAGRILPCYGNLNLQIHLENLLMSMNNLLEGTLGSLRKAWLSQLSGKRQDNIINSCIVFHYHAFL